MDYNDGCLGTQAYEYDEPLCTQPIEILKNKNNTKTQVGEICTEGQKYPIYIGINLVGRDPSCDVYLSSMTVSKKHAEIEADGKNSIFICDHSSNGTLLNNKLLQKNRSYQILHNNIIQFGEVTTIFRNCPNEIETHKQKSSKLPVLHKNSFKINTSSPKQSMSSTLINDPDISSISCNQTLLTMKQLNEESNQESIDQFSCTNVYKMEPQSSDKSNVQCKSSISKITETSDDDMFDSFNTKTQNSRITENNSNKNKVSKKHYPESIIDESIYDAVTQKITEETGTIVSNSDSETEDNKDLSNVNINLENKKSMGKISDKLNLNKIRAVHLSPLRKDHKLVIPETPYSANTSKKSLNMTLVSASTICEKPKSINDQTTLKNSYIEEQMKTSETDEDIYDQTTQTFEKSKYNVNIVDDDIYDAETQQLRTKLKFNVSSSNVNASTKYVSEEKTENDDLNNSKMNQKDIYNKQHSNNIEKNKEKKLTAVKSFVEKDCTSDDSMDLLDTQSAKHFLNKSTPEEEDLSIFDAPTQKIIHTTEPVKYNAHEDDSETDEEGLFEHQNTTKKNKIDMRSRSTEKLKNKDNVLNKKDTINNEYLSSGNTINLMKIKNKIDHYKETGKNSEAGDEISFKSKSFTKEYEESIYNAETQKLKKKDTRYKRQKNLSENSSSNESINLLEVEGSTDFFKYNNTSIIDNDIYDIPTQKITHISDIKKVNCEERGSETDVKEIIKFQNPEDNIYDAETQKINNKEILIQLQSKKNDINIFDIPTQKIMQNTKSIGSRIQDNNSEDVKIRTTTDIHCAETQKLKKNNIINKQNYSSEQENENSSSNDSIDLLETQSAVDFLKQTSESVVDVSTQMITNSSNAIGEKCKSKTDEGQFSFKSSQQIKTSFRNNFTKISNTKNVNKDSHDSDTDYDTLDAPTQKVTNYSNERDNESDSETDEEGQFSLKRSQRTTINVHDTKIADTKNSSKQKEDSDSDNDIFDAPTQILEKKVNFSTEDIQDKSFNKNIHTLKTNDFPNEKSGNNKSIRSVQENRSTYIVQVQQNIDDDDDDDNDIHNIPTQILIKKDYKNINLNTRNQNNLYTVENQKQFNSSLKQNESIDSKGSKISNKKNKKDKSSDQSNEYDAISSENSDQSDLNTNKVIFVNSSDSEGDFHGFEILKHVPKSLSEEENYIDDDIELLQTQVINQHESSVIDIDNDLDLLPTKKIDSQTCASSSGIECSNESLVEDKLRHLVGESQSKKNKNPSPLMTQQLTGVLQSTQVEKSEESKKSPTGTKRMSLKKSMTLRKNSTKVTDKSIEENLYGILGEPENTTLKDAFSQMMTQQIVNVLENSNSEDEKISPVKNKKHLNLSLKKTPTLSSSTKKESKPVKRKNDEVSKNVTSKRFKKEQVKKNNTSKTETSPSTKKKLSDSNELEFKNINSDNDIDTSKGNAITLRSRRKRCMGSNDSDANDKSKEEISDADSTNYYMSIKSKRKKNVIKDSQDLVSKTETRNDTNSQSSNVTNKKSKRKTNVLKDVQDLKKNTKSKDESIVKNRAKSKIINSKEQKSVSIIELDKKNVTETSIKESLIKSTTRGRSKIKLNTEIDDVSKNTNFINVTSRVTRNTKTSAKQEEPIKSSGTIKLSLTKRNDVWESTPTKTPEKLINKASQKKNQTIGSRNRSLRTIKNLKKVVEKNNIHNISTRLRNGKTSDKKKETNVTANDVDCSEVGEESQEVQAILSNQSIRKVRNVKKLVKEVNVTVLSPRKVKYKVLFTGIETEKWKSSLIKLGISEANTVATCTILLTDKIRRTVKFMCALALGKPILSINWLKDSLKAGKCLDNWDSYILQDSKAEKEYGFSLKDSLKKAAQRKLLKGYSILLTPGIESPPIPDLKEMIRSSDGISLTSVPRRWPENLIIVSTNEDLENARKFVTKAPRGVTVQSTEFILSGILQQELNFKMYKLKM